MVPLIVGNPQIPSLCKAREAQQAAKEAKEAKEATEAKAWNAHIRDNLGTI